MPCYRRISLADIARLFEYFADGVDLIVRQSANLLQLPEQNLVLLPQRLRWSRADAQSRQQTHQCQ